jgi:hypothetical protein
MKCIEMMQNIWYEMMLFAEAHALQTEETRADMSLSLLSDNYLLCQEFSALFKTKFP